MSSIVLQKNSSIQIVEIGPSLNLFMFNILYLLFCRRFKDAIIIGIIEFSLFSILLQGLFPDITVFETFCMILFSCFSMIFYVSIQSLIIQDAIYTLWFSPKLETILPLTEEHIYFILIISLLLFIFNILVILYYNNWKCKQYIQQGYRPMENDIYSVSLLQYHKLL